MSRRDILRTHYTGLLRRAGAWAGLGALMASMFVPTGASAVGQLTERSLTLGSSKISTSTTYLYGFKPATTTAVGSVKFQLCTSPLENVSCTGPSGADSSVPGALTLGGQISGFSKSNGTNNPSPTANVIWIENGTPQSLTSGTASTVQFATITNPSTVNQTFYARITTYAETAGSTEVDYGAVAVSTAAQITASANVQEQLAFCVYTGANCGAGGSTVNVGTTSDNILNTSTPTGGTSKMDASTNASSGYVITYITTTIAGHPSASFTSLNDTITDAGSSNVPDPGDGVAIFGINLKANSTLGGGSLGANSSGGSGVAVGSYAVADQIAFVAGSTPQTVANSAGGPSDTTTFTVSYVAQAGTTSKAGQYSALFTYVCTGTF